MGEEPEIYCFDMELLVWPREILVKDYFAKEFDNNSIDKVYLNLLLLASMNTGVNFPLMQKKPLRTHSQLGMRKLYTGEGRCISSNRSFVCEHLLRTDYKLLLCLGQIYL